jgi:hypothetical protein
MDFVPRLNKHHPCPVADRAISFHRKFSPAAAKPKPCGGKTIFVWMEILKEQKLLDLMYIKPHCETARSLTARIRERGGTRRARRGEGAEFAAPALQDTYRVSSAYNSSAVRPRLRFRRPAPDMQILGAVGVMQ